MVYFFNTRIFKSSPTQPQGIYALIGQRLTCDSDERGNVLSDERSASNHHMGTDFDKLVDGRKSANDRPIPDFDMSREGHVVYQDDMISNLAIVRYVCIRHNKALTS